MRKAFVWLLILCVLGAIAAVGAWLDGEFVAPSGSIDAEWLASVARKIGILETNRWTSGVNATNVLQVQVNALEAASNSVTTRLNTHDTATNGITARLVKHDTATNTITSRLNSHDTATNVLQSQVNSLESATNWIPLLIGGTNSVQSQINTIEGQTNGYLLDGDTLATGLYGPPGTASNQYTTRKQLYDAIDALSELTLYGATNLHPVATKNGSLREAVPGTWSISTVLNAGSNLVGTFWYTNTTAYIRDGFYIGRFYAAKSGGGTATATIQLVQTNAAGGATILLGESATSGSIGTGITSYRLTVSVDDGRVTTNAYLGVRYYLIRSGGAVTVTTYGGGTYATHINTPGLGTVSGYITDVALGGTKGATGTVVRAGNIETVTFPSWKASATGAVGAAFLESTAVSAGTYTQANWTVDADGRITAATRYTPLECCMTQATTQIIANNTSTKVNLTHSDASYLGQAQIADLTRDRFRLTRVGYWAGSWQGQITNMAQDTTFQIFTYECAPGISNVSHSFNVRLGGTAAFSPCNQIPWTKRTHATNEWIEGWIYHASGSSEGTGAARIRLDGAWLHP